MLFRRLVTDIPIPKFPSLQVRADTWHGIAWHGSASSRLSLWGWWVKNTHIGKSGVRKYTIWKYSTYAGTLEHSLHAGNGNGSMADDSRSVNCECDIIVIAQTPGI